MQSCQRTKRSQKSAVRVVVQRYGFDDRNRQAPEAKQVSADISMIRLEDLLFRFGQGNALFTRQVDRLLILLRKVDGKNEFADIVQ